MVRDRMLTMIQFDPAVMDIEVAARLGFRKGKSDFIGTLNILDRGDWIALFPDVALEFGHFSPEILKGIDFVPRTDRIAKVFKDWVAGAYYDDQATLQTALQAAEVDTPLREVIIKVLDGEIDDDTIPLLRFAVLSVLEGEVPSGIRLKGEQLWEELSAVDHSSAGLITLPEIFQPRPVIHSAGQEIRVRNGDSHIVRRRLAVDIHEGDSVARVFSPQINYVANLPAPTYEDIQVADIVAEGEVVDIDVAAPPVVEVEEVPVSELEIDDQVHAADDVQVAPVELDKQLFHLVDESYKSLGSFEEFRDGYERLIPDMPFSIRANPSVFGSELLKAIEMYDGANGEVKNIETYRELAIRAKDLGDNINSWISTRGFDTRRFGVELFLSMDVTTTLHMSGPYHVFPRRVGVHPEELDVAFMDSWLQEIRERLVDAGELLFRAEECGGKEYWARLTDQHRGELREAFKQDHGSFRERVWELLTELECAPFDDEVAAKKEIEDCYLMDFKVGLGRTGFVTALVGKPDHGDTVLYNHIESGLVFTYREDADQDSYKNSQHIFARDCYFSDSFKSMAEQLLDDTKIKTILDGEGIAREEVLGRMESLDLLERSKLRAAFRNGKDQMVSQLATALQSHSELTSKSTGFQKRDYAEKMAAKFLSSCNPETSALGMPHFLYVSVSSSYIRWGVPDYDASKLGVWRFEDFEKDIVRSVRKKRGHGSSKVFPISLIGVFDADTYEKLEELAIEREVSRQQDIRGDKSDGGKPQERQDTGIVYGLARKDLAFNWSDELEAYLRSSSQAQAHDLVKRDRIWSKPSLKTLEKEGYEPAAAWMICHYHKKLPTKPHHFQTSDVKEYVEGIANLRDGLMACKTYDDVVAYLTEWHEKTAKVSVSDSGYVNWKDIASFLYVSRGRHSLKPCDVVNECFISPVVLYRMENETKHNTSWEWAETKKKSDTTQRLGLYSAPHLEHIERTGEAVLRAEEVTELGLIRAFGFSGVEYGNWTNQKERGQCLSFTYDAFDDIAKLYGIPRTAVSMGGKLGLCFGSRGHGGRRAALAHYEPGNIAINLTRLYGAGSLGHEYAHALDGFLAKKAGLGRVAYLSDWAHGVRGLDQDGETFKLGEMEPEFLAAFRRVYQTIRYAPESFELDAEGRPTLIAGEVPVDSDFYQYADRLDKSEKRKNPYWSKPIEMFARATERWMAYRLDSMGIQNNYLVNHLRWGEDSSIGSVYPGLEQTKMMDRAMEEVVAHIRVKSEQIDHPIGEAMDIAVIYSHDTVEQFGDRSLLAQCCLDEIRRMTGGLVNAEFLPNLVDQDGCDVAGAYDPTLILASLSYRFADLSTAYHEVFHAADHLFLSEAERSELYSVFSDGHGRELLERALERTGRGHLLPYLENPADATAYAFQLWVEGDLELTEAPKPAGLFERIADTLRSILGITRSYGFDTAESLFRDLYDGRMASERAGLVKSQVIGSVHNHAEQNSPDKERYVELGVA